MRSISAANLGSNNTSSSPAEDLPSKAEGIALCSAFALEAVFIVVGNLLAIVLFAVNKNLRKKSLFFVINMAFADLMLGTVVLPLHIYHLGDHYSMWTSSLYTSLCRVQFYLLPSPPPGTPPGICNFFLTWRSIPHPRARRKRQFPTPGTPHRPQIHCFVFKIDFRTIAQPDVLTRT